MHISEGSTVVIPVMKNPEMDPKLIGRTNVTDQNFTEMQAMSPTLSTILSPISPVLSSKYQAFYCHLINAVVKR